MTAMIERIRFLDDESYSEYVKQMDEKVFIMQEATKEYEDCYRCLCDMKEELQQCYLDLATANTLALTQIDIIARLTKLLTKEVE
jgi:hypothetical protein